MFTLKVIQLFSGAGANGKSVLQVFGSAYSDTRYQAGYRLTKDEAMLLIEKVKSLMNIVQNIIQANSH